MSAALTREQLLEQLGLGTQWVLREGASDLGSGSDIGVTQSEPAPTRVAVSADAAPKSLQARWQTLEQQVSGCTGCTLCQSRTRTVLGKGDRSARWLFVGEGPGRQEDLQGEPFVGPAGKLLDNMLHALGLKGGANAYIANIVKCRPVGADGRDRVPSAEEVAACLPFLQQQIELVQPSVIVALGRTAAVALLNQPPDTPVSSLRGKVHRVGDLPLVVTYHPAYLLRKPADKAHSWRDLCLALNEMSTVA